MTLSWGKIEVPELTLVSKRLGTPEDPENLSGLFHHPSGLRMRSVQTVYEARGDKLDYLLSGPKDEGWTLRVCTHNAGNFWKIRTLAQFGLSCLEYEALPGQKQIDRKKKAMAIYGQEYLVSAVTPEADSPPARWSAERRDALVLMICFYQEGCGDTSDPFPSTVELRAEGIPEALRGTFRNPIWGRQT